MTSPRRYRLDPSVRRIDGGRVLIGGSPLKLLRLTAAGAAVVDRLQAGELVASDRLVESLLDGGAVHPEPTPSSGGRASVTSEITAVVPARDAPVHQLAAVVDRLRRAVAAAVVVDDGSRPAVEVPGDVQLVRIEHSQGPAAARTAGLARVATPLVLFVDADVVLPDDDGAWIDPLLAHLDDERVALVAPRVVSDESATTMSGWPGAIAAYERARSPLDLGGGPARVLARTRVSYVPSAVWLARADALVAAGAFDAALHTGEDVDLAWRLAAAGHTVRYEPTTAVGHRPRATVSAFARQRFGYGASAGPLARRHPGALAPVGVSAWSAGAWAAVASQTAIGATAGALAAAGSTAALARKLGGLDHPGREALRLAGLGHLHAGRQLAGAIARPWWPPALVLALCSRRARRVTALAIVAPALADWWHTRAVHRLHPLRYLALRVLDDGAYGAGVWAGCRQAGTIDPLVPDLTSWPRPSRFERPPRHAGER